MALYGKFRRAMVKEIYSVRKFSGVPKVTGRVMAPPRDGQMTAREVNSIEPATPQYLKWFEHPITFSRADHPHHILFPGRFPLVLNPTIGRVVLMKTLIDGGTGTNILFTHTLDAMGQSRRKLSPSDTPFHGIVP